MSDSNAWLYELFSVSVEIYNRLGAKRKRGIANSTNDWIKWDTSITRVKD
jgi:hypothetical protein